MKRSPELSALSRDHHRALYAALQLRRAARETATEAIESFQEFWHDHGRRHFRIEEELLLPGFAAGGGDPGHPLVSQVLTDHIDIRARARDLRSESPLGELHELGERLKAHVRLEEEKLFPLIEETLEPAALGALGEELDRAERDEG
jgi:hemerythrin-like domain-containing protein